MVTESSSAHTDGTTPAANTPKNQEALAPIDIDDFDINAVDDELALPNESDLGTKKMDARRKIEIYWEKRRLQEELGENVDIDFDF